MSKVAPRKILILRFSSIGDIVLTFPVVRSLKAAYPECQIDYVTKKGFQSLLNACEGISEVYTLENSLQSLKKQIDFRSYDAVLDLHHNIRTRLFTAFTGARVYRFPKNNWQKWLLTSFKIKPKKQIHVVERYFQPAQAAFGLSFSPEQVKYIVPEQDQIKLEEEIGLNPKQFIAFAIGAQFSTKRLPTDLMIDLLQKVKFPIVLLGGKEDQKVAEQIIAAIPNQKIISKAGNLSIHASAWIVQNAAALLTHDTGLMHIAASFDLPIHLIWGNTTKDFGMYPFRPEQMNSFHYEVQDLSCRPCSKIGHQSCPKGHFKCMRQQNLERIAQQLNATKI